MKNKHINITPGTTYLDFLLPDGRYLYYEFKPNHKLRTAMCWYLGKLNINKCPETTGSQCVRHS